MYRYGNLIHIESQAFILPSLSGTLGIPPRLALNPKMPKEPSRPSRSEESFWNFKHIVNLKRIHLYNATNLKYSYPILEIRY
jgi:hypothetical protein